MSADRRHSRNNGRIDVTTALNDLLDFGPEPVVTEAPSFPEVPSFARAANDATRRLQKIVNELDELNRRVDRLIKGE